MKHFFSSSQIVGTFLNEEQSFEVCATAEADFDEARCELLVTLDSFIRPLKFLAREVHSQPDWLPKKHSMKEQVNPEEAPELAREIFQRWARTLRQSIPAPASARAAGKVT